MKKVKLYLNYAGYCVAKEKMAIRNGTGEIIKFHALWGLIKHPTQGFILFDTGYTDRFLSATKYFPSRIYYLATKVEIPKKEEIVNQLKAHQIAPDEIKHIVISHFHADHTGGLIDFPNATIYASSKALNYTLNLNKYSSFTKGVLKDLLPNDLKERTKCIDQICIRKQDEVFGVKYDLFGDESIYLVDLPGHAKGQLGMQLSTEKRNYFLVADAIWLKQSIEKKVLPNPIVRLFFDSWKDYKSTHEKIKIFHSRYPETLIVPTHCHQTTRDLVQPIINFDVL
jgi:glyoxylase-like metal-dependent hydrolase (beta-lactamase superfamily II)